MESNTVCEKNVIHDFMNIALEVAFPSLYTTLGVLSTYDIKTSKRLSMVCYQLGYSEDMVKSTNWASALDNLIKDMKKRNDRSSEANGAITMLVRLSLRIRETQRDHIEWKRRENAILLDSLSGSKLTLSVNPEVKLYDTENTPGERVRVAPRPW